VVALVAGEVVVGEVVVDVDGRVDVARIGLLHPIVVNMNSPVTSAARTRPPGHASVSTATVSLAFLLNTAVSWWSFFPNWA
jgi:hypothetical protein